MKHPTPLVRSLLWLWLAFLGPVPRADAGALAEQQSTTTSLRMLVGVPDGPTGQRYPLVLYLHGFSLRGSDLNLLKQYGPVAPWPVGSAPYILVAPQLPKTRLL